MNLLYNNLFRVNLAVILLLQILIQTACKKLADVSPPVTGSTGGSVYLEDATAAAVLSGIYANMSSGSGISNGINGVSILSGLSADELNLLSGIAGIKLNLLFKNALSSQEDVGPWKSLYTYLHTANSAIEGLAISTSLTPAVKKQLEGEAKFMRAFSHFYLVNLYGDVPLAMTSDYRVNATISRTPKAQVYQQIITDLKDAQSLLSEQYLSADVRMETPDRVRPTKWAATALLARVYLYTGDWTQAEAQATAVISNNTLYDTVALNEVFLQNSKEAIWQLPPVDEGWNTWDARVFIPVIGFDEAHPVYASDFLFKTFEANDRRKSDWLHIDIASGKPYPFKYKSATQDAPVTEHLMVLRLAEQYLIRAEARIQMGSTVNGIADLNILRARASKPAPNNLPALSTTLSKEDALQKVQHEKQVELFTEWGHRWLDLKRSGKIDEVMTAVTPQKGGVWQTTDQLYPLPNDDIRLNPKLTQNQGY